MSFKKEVTQEIETGAYNISLNDDSKLVSISYSEYVDGVATKFVKTVQINFDKLLSEYPEEFASLNDIIQTLCDEFNPENPSNVLDPVIEVADEVESIDEILEEAIDVIDGDS